MKRYRLSGWRRQARDGRDVVLDIARRFRTVRTCDLSGHMGPQLDQLKEGSCGPNSVEEILQWLQSYQELPVVGSSRLFTYYNTRLLMGTVDEDSGVDNRTMMKALARYGTIPEEIDPYDDTPESMIRVPGGEMYSLGAANLIDEYAAIVQSLGQMQATLDTLGRPFLFGFNVYSQIESDEAAATGLIADPSGSPIGGHDVTVCGYTSVELPGVLPGNKWPAGTFKVRNHWTRSDGLPWGDGGYGYVRFGYATNVSQAGDFWVIKRAPGTKKPPPPPGQSSTVFSFSWDGKTASAVYASPK